MFNWFYKLPKIVRLWTSTIKHKPSSQCNNLLRLFIRLHSNSYFRVHKNKKVSKSPISSYPNRISKQKQ